MDITRANMSVFFAGFQQLFKEGAESVSSDFLKFSSIVNSAAAMECYRFLQRFGGLREWVGDRIINNFMSGKLTIENKDFEDTVAVLRNDLEDDQLGMYADAIKAMGAAAGELWRDLAVAALAGGKTAEWLDGLPFFATNRKYGKNVICNKATAALSAEAYKQARKTMFQYKNAANQNGKVRPVLLVVGPDNEDVAFSVLQNELTLNLNSGSGTVAAAKNPWAGKSEYMVLPELGSEWFLMDTSKPTKPVIVQKRREPTLAALDSPTDENVFFKKEYIYGCDGRGAAFLSVPHLIYGSFPA